MLLALSATLVMSVLGHRQPRRGAIGPGLSGVDAVRDRLPQAQVPKAKVWTGEQVGAFLDAIEGDRLYAMYLLIVMAGLRRGEAVGLRWSDVELDDQVIAVRQQVVAVGREVRIGPPKTQG